MGEEIVRRETGWKMRMKEPYIEGVATHDDPESCVSARKGDGEAFDRGTGGLGIEPRNQLVRGAYAVISGGRQHEGERQRELLTGPARSETPRTPGIFQHGNREILSLPGEHGAPGRSRKANGRTLETHGEGKSDGLVVPKKLPNNVASAAAEVVEGRGPAKGNTDQQNAPRTQGRTSAPSALDRVRRAAKKDRSARFTALFHYVTVDRLRDAFQLLERKAAPGIDGVSWKQYGVDLEARLWDLHERLHRGAYRARPSRRVYIPKADGRQRPLGIAAVEDKIVQRTIVEVMNAIYEQDFLGFSYGFRPGRSQHQALDALYVGIHRKKVNYVLDADIRGFFGAPGQAWRFQRVKLPLRQGEEPPHRESSLALVEVTT
ncbi:reverse transcriptase domain-containing protein [Polyangium mundeleinium]|uniref:Reverse transcriptase domain-containing protein n=1 Tax=Polyangium mundeleinium TaxID=2995306 RepID=A0ABT5F2Q5_9BACT|nr:reverse transcriptase domain-containing protein [Polyangium mundeleinium]MDC0747884.1 reverse transcriptase domain-containing protein [Polyangium mundeleinium]